MRTPRLSREQSHIPQLVCSVQHAERFTITYSDFFCRWRNSTLADEQQPIIAAESLMRDVAKKSSVHVPSGQEWIMVEENKCYRVFSEWRDRIRAKSAWQTPFGIALALGATLTTSSSATTLGLKKAHLKLFFFFCFLGCLAWLVIEIVKGIKGKDASVENFIADLKEGTSPQGASLVVPAVPQAGSR